MDCFSPVGGGVEDELFFICSARDLRALGARFETLLYWLTVLRFTCKATDSFFVPARSIAMEGHGGCSLLSVLSNLSTALSPSTSSITSNRDSDHDLRCHQIIKHQKPSASRPKHACLKIYNPEQSNWAATNRYGAIAIPILLVMIVTLRRPYRAHSHYLSPTVCTVSIYSTNNPIRPDRILPKPSRAGRRMLFHAQAKALGLYPVANIHSTVGLTRQPESTQTSQHSTQIVTNS